jgi:choline dehydrogenase-like flavoprotein
MLDDTRDMFGMRRVILDWHVNSADLRTVRTLGLEVAKEVARKNVARVHLKKFILDENEEIADFGQHAHQMGTTRMSNSPKDGVVDRDLKVHGMQNIYIAGSSVFPTGGGANPTLTLVMLAERLGTHLSRT